MTEPALCNSRFIAFFDECGDHSLTDINPEFPVFVLSTVIVERAHYAQQIIGDMAAFKLRYFAHEGINLHSRDIRKAEGPFSILQNPTVRTEFLPALSDLVSRSPFTLFVTVIQKIPHKQRYGNSAENPYEVALAFSFERILHFMETHGETHLPVIAEGRGKNEDNQLLASFHRLMTQGTQYNAAERFKRLSCPLSFRKKQDNIAGIQLADLCAHPTARHVLKPEASNIAFDVIRPKFYENGAIKGLKVFPK